MATRGAGHITAGGPDDIAINLINTLNVETPHWVHMLGPVLTGC